MSFVEAVPAPVINAVSSAVGVAGFVGNYIHAILDFSGGVGRGDAGRRDAATCHTLTNAA